MPGRGGVTRGRGDAEMIWGEETPGASERFEAKSLPSAQLFDPESSAVLAVGAAPPVVDPRAESAGLAEASVSAGKTAWRRRLAPSHREAVKAFFSGPRRE